ncbi:unnamed protein product [Camellia sinensis]
MILTLLLIVLYCKRKQKKKSPTESCEGDRFLRVSYGELFKATEGFSSSNLIGAGSFSTVYKGVLPPQEKVVAVKVLDIERLGASKSFFAECEALRKTRHRNLLKIITACSKRLSSMIIKTGLQSRPEGPCKEGMKEGLKEEIWTRTWRDREFEICGLRNWRRVWNGETWTLARIKISYS